MSPEVNELLRVFHKFKRLNLSSILPDVTPMEFQMLGAVLEIQERQGNDDVTVSAVCKNVCVSTAAVSRMLRTLEEKGLIYREVDTKDRRNTYVRLTQKGKTTHENVDGIMSDLVSSILTQMGRDNMKTLAGVLMQLYDIAEKEIAARKK